MGVFMALIVLLGLFLMVFGLLSLLITLMETLLIID